MTKANKTQKTKEAEEKEKLTQEQEKEQGKETQETDGEVSEEKDESETGKLKEQLLRAMAEYDNYRKRTARERVELEADITARVASEFLTVVDSLERALESECSDANYKKGIEMIYESLFSVLDKLGVSQIETGGEFNPAYHQAVQKVNDEDFESGAVTQTFQKGYKIGEKIIRFAMVAVNE